MSYINVITETVAEMVRTRRSHGPSTSGPARNIPALTAQDMIAIAVTLTPGMTGAIARVSTGFLGFSCLNERFVWSTGEINVSKMLELGEIGDMKTDGSNIGCSARQFLAGWAVDGIGWRRALVNPHTHANPTVFTICTDKDETHVELVQFLRQTMRAWNRMIVAMTTAIGHYGIGPDVGKTDCTEFIAAIHTLAGELDIIRENPPPSLASELKGALRAALKDTGEALEDAGRIGGELAAGAANVAGKTIGEIIAGFAEGVGLAGLALSGFVVYVAAKRYGWM